MAQQVMTYLIDDLDGGEANETVTFALDGIPYEIDLSDKNAQTLREILEPYRRRGRRAGTNNLRAKGLTPLHRAKATVTHIEDPAKIRAWAALYDLPVNERGRVNSKYRDAYTAFQNNDRKPLRHLLEENNLDPDLADTNGKTVSAEPEAPKAAPAEDRHRLTAQKAPNLSSAQLTRLRKAVADEHGRYISPDGRDASTCEALVKRGLFAKLEDRVWEVTPAGRIWFDVHGISPDL